ncbi:MAG: NAD(P)H-hydrate dehydratase, partial [Bacteroidales bacterium]|nr:NAD(P)H-hydrate dehydratase [Bacteroidales bacterium]
MNNNQAGKIFSSEQVKGIDQYTISNEPIASIDLMECAAGTVFQWILNRYENTKKVKIFVGPGNNGGDGLAVARMLAEKKYSVTVYWVKFTENCSKDWMINFQRLKDQGIANVGILTHTDKKPQISTDDLVIDAIFGSGLSRPLEGFPAEIVDHINAAGAKVISIDIPSGLFGEDNSGNDPDNIIKASYTLSFQFPKLAFFFPDNEEFVGEWSVLPIGLHPEIINSTDTGYFFLTGSFIKSKLKVRSKFSHKGTFGHALLISGNYGRMGAAVLASRACLRTGTGLITAHVPRKGYDILQNSVPEAMISLDESDIIFTGIPDMDQYNAVGIGPAIGLKDNTQKAFSELLKTINIPLVIDADGINILGENKEWLKQLPKNTILTPHPKEFERIAGKTSDGYNQIQRLIELAEKYQIFIVLKGAHTAIASPDGLCYFNITGNPGMATAGSGDVLTGIILSLLGQGYCPGDAAFTGVYLHGLAGDCAVVKTGEESLIANDIIDYLG